LSIDHVGFEVSDLARTTHFYDPVFRALGGRPAYGHVALQASGKAAVDAAYAEGLAHGGADRGAPGQRPQYGRRYYAAYLADPDGLRVEIVSRR
jgi:catechol 2,3-dioxygenase-like lactoylglutathione lyase family enzyme